MLNLNKEGVPFSEISGCKHNNQTVSVSNKSNEGFRYLGVANDAELQPTPNPKAEREILFMLIIIYIQQDVSMT